MIQSIQKAILPFLILLLCFSCKNSNLDGGNSNNSTIENNTQNSKSDSEQVDDWTDSNNTETYQDESNDNSSTPEYTDENIVRCSKCNAELVTPTIRACYICNEEFSGWGFIKQRYGVDSEQSESIVNCFPELNIHNSLFWTQHEDACCSRKCAMDL